MKTIVPDVTMAPTLAGRSIAIIEDDLTTAMVARNICRKLGAACTRHFTGSDEAAAALSDPQITIDLVLLDMVLGASDGLSALRTLDAAGLGAEIVPVSGSDPRVLDAAVRLLSSRGFKVHPAISKPLTAAKLIGALAAGMHAADAGDQAAINQPLAGDLAAALARGEFHPWYQPKQDTRTGAITGVEVLVRWCPPSRGVIVPGGFIRGLEEAGLIGAMTEHLMDVAARDFAGLDAAGHRLGMAVNISALTLTELDLPERLAGILAVHRIAPSRVTLEITESAVLVDPLQTLEAATRLRLRGFALSIDDFGTGWSSLDQLRVLPFTELKIDRSFVRNAPDDADRRVILEAMVSMAHGLDLQVVAEGVETAAELELLRAMGVRSVQGWFTGRAMNIEALRRELMSRTQTAAPSAGIPIPAAAQNAILEQQP